MSGTNGIPTVGLTTSGGRTSAISVSLSPAVGRRAYLRRGEEADCDKNENGQALLGGSGNSDSKKKKERRYKFILAEKVGLKKRTFSPSSSSHLFSYSKRPDVIKLIGLDSFCLLHSPSWA